MTQLLVSVNSPEEAQAAIAGGADLIDAKDPRAGSLGAVPLPTLTAILDTVAGRRPVSAAFGEWADRTTVPPLLPAGLAYAKLGLAGVREVAELAMLPSYFAGVSPVLVAYADHGRAGSPNPHALAEYAVGQQYRVFLVDTYGKDGSTLLDWLSVAELQPLLAELQAHGVCCALAGSLQAAHIAELQPLKPTWFAVRGAVCDGQRTGAVNADKVRALRALLRATEEPNDPADRRPHFFIGGGIGAT